MFPQKRDGFTPAIVAARRDKRRVIEKIFATGGAEVLLQPYSYRLHHSASKKAEDGWTVAHFAASVRGLTVLEALHALCAVNPHAERLSGYEAADDAAAEGVSPEPVSVSPRGGHWWEVRTLRQRSSAGATPVHVAAEHGQESVLRALARLEGAAVLQDLDGQKRSVLQICRERGGRGGDEAATFVESAIMRHKQRVGAAKRAPALRRAAAEQAAAAAELRRELVASSGGTRLSSYAVFVQAQRAREPGLGWGRFVREFIAEYSHASMEELQLSASAAAMCAADDAVDAVSRVISAREPQLVAALAEVEDWDQLAEVERRATETQALLEETLLVADGMILDSGETKRRTAVQRAADQLRASQQVTNYATAFGEAHERGSMLPGEREWIAERSKRAGGHNERAHFIDGA